MKYCIMSTEKSCTVSRTKIKYYFKGTHSTYIHSYIYDIYESINKSAIIKIYSSFQRNSYILDKFLNNYLYFISLFYK